MPATSSMRATVSVLACFCAAAAAAAPRIVCDRPALDFGERDEGETVHAEFVLRNVGDAPLRIDRLRPACGCTVATLDQPLLAPGSQTVVRVDFTLRGRQGPQSKSVTVQSDDPQTPYLTLWLNGIVTRELALDPPYVNFGSLAPDAVVEREVRLVSRRPEIVITNVVSDHPRIAVAGGGVPASGARSFALTTVPPLEPGQTRATVTVLTDHPSKAALRVFAVAYVPPAVRVLPAEVLLQRSAAAPVARTVVLYPGAASNFQVLGIDNPLPGVQVACQPASGGSYRLDIRDLRPAPEFDGCVIRVRTDLPTRPDIEIPIRLID